VQLSGVYATLGGDYNLGTQAFHPRWQLETAVGHAVELRLNEDGCTVCKNWDADMGALSCNIELKAHTNWNGRVREGEGRNCCAAALLCPTRTLPRRRSVTRSPKTSTNETLTLASMPSCFLLASFTAAKISPHALGITPRLLLLVMLKEEEEEEEEDVGGGGGPTIVCVLPEAVWPYAIMQPL
jgi:hypothetical protein